MFDVLAGRGEKRFFHGDNLVLSLLLSLTARIKAFILTWDREQRSGPAPFVHEPSSANYKGMPCSHLAAEGYDFASTLYVGRSLHRDI